jgi:signal transduction histidine kinase
MHQALLHLARNAIGCTRPGGTVAIAAEMVGGQLQVSVRDDGPGIAPGDLARLFVPFDGIDVGHDGEPVGTGLGLPVTKALVESMGATLDVMSQRGSGSKFIMRLRTPEAELPQAA